MGDSASGTSYFLPDKKKYTPLFVMVPIIIRNCIEHHMILDDINTHSHQAFSGHIEAHCLQSYQENCTK